MSHVTIFGAGASREYQVLPDVGPFPLDGTFLTDMEQVWTKWGDPASTSPGHHDYDMREWDWPGLRAQILETTGTKSLDHVGFEEAYTAIAETFPFLEDRFCRGIELVLFRKLRGEKLEHMPVHADYVRRFVRPSDTLITFNYDPLVDLALSGLSGTKGLRWHPADGYGIDLDGQLVHGDGIRPLNVQDASNVRLLKLHGSLNWVLPAAEWPSRPRLLLRLLANSFRGPGHILVRAGGIAYRSVFVPPRANKNYETFGLTSLWESARSAILQAETLTIIGYSFPDTDQDALKLVTGAAKESKTLRRIVLVTPDEQPAHQLRSELPLVEHVPATFGKYMEEVASRD